MQPAVSRHARFEEDCKRYQSSIDAIIDLDSRNDATQLLMKLINDVFALDKLHEDFSSLGKSSAELSQLRQCISATRKQLNNICSMNNLL